MSAASRVDVKRASADLLFTNATVITCDAARSRVEAVGVRAGRIHAVGDTQQVRAALGGAPTEIDAGGRTLVPGLIDAHNHFLMTCEAFDGINARYPEVGSIADLLGAVDASAERTP